MKLKSFVALLLLAFVAVSVGYFVAKKSRRTAVAVPQTSVPANAPGTQSAGNNEAVRQVVLNSKVVVYYFHGNTRCFTCRAIENFSRAAIENGFPNELQKGRLEFRTVNVEESASEHFVKDYQLVTRSLVLVRFSEGKQEKWKNLDRVWELVRDNDLFSRYVQTETKQFLGGA